MNNGADTLQAFKACPDCGHLWARREEMLADPHVALVGYQPHFRSLTAGLFLFNHSCGSTFAITAGQFADLYRGPVFEGSKTGTAQCPAYCLRQGELSRCPNECECAYVREVLQAVKNWKKGNAT